MLHSLFVGQAKFKILLDFFDGFVGLQSDICNVQSKMAVLGILNYNHFRDIGIFSSRK